MDVNRNDGIQHGSAHSRRMFMRSSAVAAIAVGIASHTPCTIAAIGTVSGLLGNCVDGSCEYSLDKFYPRIPKKEIRELNELDPELQNRFMAEFVKERPEVFDVIAQKKKEYVKDSAYDGKNIKVELVFAEDGKGNLCLGVCKDGLLCECSSPAVFNINDEKGIVSQMWNRHKAKLYNSMMIGGAGYLAYRHGFRAGRTVEHKVL